MIAGGNVGSIAINTPSIIAGNGSSAVMLLPAESLNRLGFTVQNVGTTTAYVAIGQAATSSVYHYAIKGGSQDGDGTGGSIFFTSGVIPQGAVTMFGASTAKCVCLEVAP